MAFVQMYSRLATVEAESHTLFLEIQWAHTRIEMTLILKKVRGLCVESCSQSSINDVRQLQERQLCLL